MKKSDFPKFISYPNEKNTQIISTIDHHFWKNEDVALDWVTTEYPLFHTHQHYEIFIILGGKIIHTIDNKKYTLKAGDACLIRPNNKHNLIFSEPSPDYLHINFTITTEYFEKMIKNYSSDITTFINKTNDFSPYKINNIELNDIKNSTLQIQVFPQYTKKDVLLCKVIINRLLSIYIEQKYLQQIGATSFPTWLNEFLNFLYSPESFTLTISQLAERTPYCHSQLYRFFKSHFKMSLIEFHNHIKFNYAKDLLAHSNSSTLEICNDIGFYSLSHFNHLFKKIFGLSPIQYRKQYVHPAKNND